MQEGAYLKVTFAHEGIGIPEEHLPKIAGPLFLHKQQVY